MEEVWRPHDEGAVVGLQRYQVQKETTRAEETNGTEEITKQEVEDEPYLTSRTPGGQNRSSQGHHSED